MAYSVESAGALAQFIYVWPSRELASRSWSWPGAWHEAFQDAASRLGLAVALYGLDGRRFTRRIVTLQLSVGSVEFRVKRRGTSIFVTVSDFTASVSPRPDSPDGTRQPGAVDGLVLGLHGSDKGVYLVVFHGQMPPVPVGTSPQGGKPIAGRRKGRQAGDGVSSAKPGMASETSRHAAKAAESTDSWSCIRAGSRRIEAAESSTAARGKASSGRRTGSAAGQGKEKWSAIVWRTHTGSLAILPLGKNARPHRWLEMDSTLFGHGQSWLLH